MKLNLSERLVIADVLPQRGNFLEMIIKKDVLDKVTVKQGDIEKFGVKVDGDKISWTSQEEIEVDFTPAETEMIKKQLSDLDKNKQLEDKHIPTYKKFNN